MVFLRFGSGGQAAVEYLIIMGIALLLFSAFLAITYYYSSGFNSSDINQNLALAETSLGSSISYIASQQTGATSVFSFSLPQLNQDLSYICGNFIVLSSGNNQVASSLALNTIGELPVTGGTYTGYVTLANVNGQQEAYLKFQLPISFINTSYVFFNGYLDYNVSFYNEFGSLVHGVNFTISVYGQSNTLLYSTSIESPSGASEGQIPINQYYPNLRVIVYVQKFNLESSLCFTPANLLPITFTNSQSQKTGNGFQQQLTIDSSRFSHYEAKNLSNVQFFYQNDTIIKSWLEGGDIATFNGVNSIIYNSTTAPLDFESDFTINAWVLLNSYNPQGSWIYSEGAPQVSLMFYVNQSGNLCVSTFNSTTHYFGDSGCSSITVPLHTWTMVTAVLSNGGPQPGSGSFTVYVNDVGSTSPGQEENVSSSHYFAVGGNTGNLTGGGQTLNGINGAITNLQVYTAALSSIQINQLYTNGMASGPIVRENNVIWMPLTGNANDIKGEHDGSPQNIGFLAPGSASKSTVYWLNIGNIPAFSSLGIYMAFFPTSYDVMNPKNTGEAPEWSSKYGAYDDGAEVFTFYYNFSGTSLGSQWAVDNQGTGSTGAYTVNNNLTTNTTASQGVNVLTTATYSYPAVFEWFAGPFTKTTSPESFQFGNINTTMDGETIYLGKPGFINLQYATSSSSYTNTSAIAVSNTASNNLYGIAATGSNVLLFFNYVQVKSVSTGYTPTNIPFSAILNYKTSLTTPPLYYVRIRDYPPFGDMPSVSIGTIQ